MAEAATQDRPETGEVLDKQEPNGHALAPVKPMETKPRGRTPSLDTILRSNKTLEEREARALTESVKADLASLWAKCQRLYKGGAHSALGYSNWGDYFEQEFKQSRARGYQLLRAAAVREEIERKVLDPAKLDAMNEKQAREFDRLSEAQRQSVIRTINEDPKGVKSSAISATALQKMRTTTHNRAEVRAFDRVIESVIELRADRAVRNDPENPERVSDVKAALEHLQEVYETLKSIKPQPVA
jgi:hypothetical protein